MLRTYSSTMSTLAAVVALVLGVGGIILAILSSSFLVLIYFAIFAALFYLMLRSLSLLMEATADNADALAEIKKTLHTLSAASAADPAPGTDTATAPASQSAPVDTSPTAEIPNPQFQGAKKLPNAGTVASKIPTTDGRIRCSKCGYIQPAGQIRCYECGAQFQHTS